jgi:hypothetical protein
MNKQTLTATKCIIPIKIEVGAIGIDDNATFTERNGLCANEVVGCD